MSRFVTVHLGCDWDGCETIATEEEGTVAELTVALDGKQGKTFLLCKPHRDQFDEFVLPLMQAGIKAEAPKKAPATRSKQPSPSPSPIETGGKEHTADPYRCEVADCGRVMHNRTGMAQHVIRSHGYENLAAYEAVFGHQDRPDAD